MFDVVVQRISKSIYILFSKFETNLKIKKKTRGQRPNESQKAVIIYMMKSVGEIASKMWPVVSYLTHFGKIFNLTVDLDL